MHLDVMKLEKALASEAKNTFFFVVCNFLTQVSIALRQMLNFSVLGTKRHTPYAFFSLFAKFAMPNNQ